MKRLAIAATAGLTLAAGYGVYEYRNHEAAASLSDERVTVAERVASCAIESATVSDITKREHDGLGLLPHEDKDPRQKVVATLAIRHTDAAKPILEKYAEDNTITWSMGGKANLLDDSTTPPTDGIPIAAPRFSNQINDTFPDADRVTIFPKKTYATGTRIGISVTTESRTFNDDGVTTGNTTTHCAGSQVMTQAGWSADTLPLAVVPPKTTTSFDAWDK